MTIFHQGTDGACYEYLYIQDTNPDNVYVCTFDATSFIDDNDYLQSERCFQN